MTVDIHTSDPQNVDPQRIADVLIKAGYLVDSVSVNDGDRTWEVNT